MLSNQERQVQCNMLFNVKVPGPHGSVLWELFPQLTGELSLSKETPCISTSSHVPTVTLWPGIGNFKYDAR